MIASEIIADIEHLRRFVGEVLDYDSDLVLSQVIAQLENSQAENESRRRSSGRPPWQIKISSTRPLKFLPSKEKGVPLLPEIFCDLAGPGQAEWPLETQNLVIRVWSLDRALSFRPELDAEAVSKWLDDSGLPNRVILRLHFDKAEPGQKGTLFHLQVGGKPVEEEREKCWLGGIPGVPRIPMHPMDLILACELVIANFFHEHFQRVCEDPEWREVVKRAELRTLRRYYEICWMHFRLGEDHLGREHTLLKRLWNV